eukprot:6973018-Prymnesium_polylepis.1
MASSWRRRKTSTPATSCSSTTVVTSGRARSLQTTDARSTDARRTPSVRGETQRSVGGSLAYLNHAVMITHTCGIEETFD